MNYMRNQKSKVSGILVFVTLLFGVNPIVVKMGITAMSPFVFTTSRLLVAVIAFILVLVLSGTWRPVERKDWVSFGKMSVEAFVFQLGMITALEFVSAAVVATMIGLMPISVLLILNRRGVKRIGKNHYLGATITFIGVFLVSGIIGSFVNINEFKGLLGVGILLIAQFSAAAYMTESEKLLSRYSNYQVSTIMFTGVFLIFLMITIPEVANNGLPKWTGYMIACIVYGGVVSLCLANNLWIWGIKKIGSHKTIIFNNLPPVFALITGILFLNEIPLPSQVMGVVLVLVGLYVFNGRLTQEHEE